MIQVRFWGTRGSITSPGLSNWEYGGNTACVQLTTYQNHQPGAASHPDNPQLILDGGSGLASLQKRLLKGTRGTKPGELHILLSHYHWDHIIGLPFFAPLFIKGNRIAFYSASVDNLQSSIERLFTSVYSPVKGVQNVIAELSYHQIDPYGMDIAGFRIQAIETHHPGQTLTFCIQYGPDTVVYTPDHAVGDKVIDANLLSLANMADLWILNGHYTPKELEHHKTWGHSSYQQAINLALQAQVKTVALFHHNPDHDDTTLDQMHLDAIHLAAASNLEVLMAKDGMLLDIGH